jgi:hypothetical protein
MTMLMALSVWLGVPPVVALMTLWVQEGGLLHQSSRWRVLGTSLDDLVEFPAVEPDTPALRAIINLDTLSFAHHERDPTDRTRHTGGTGHRRAS